MLARYKSFAGLIVLMFWVSAVHTQTDWTENENNPVLDFGTSGEWDAGVVFLPTVIPVGDTLKMWYSGAAQSQIFGNPEIGYAWSLDGANWNRHPNNPVLPKRPGEWDEAGTGDCIVTQDGDTLRMWYLGWSAEDPVQPGSKIGYAWSLDGIDWNRMSAPVMQADSTGDWDDDILIAESVVKDGDTFKMWYSGGQGPWIETVLQIGYATSTDGINWTKYDDPATTDQPFQFSDPVVKVGDAGSWDPTRAWAPWVRKTGTGYEMWYSGTELFVQQSIGYATSTDGITWTKFSGNPLFDVSFINPRSWANDFLGPTVVFDGEQYSMWFSGFLPGFPFPGRIGYATSSVATFVQENPAANIPDHFALHQNFPNPFNPETEISFQLPRAEHVVLRIFNTLGQVVRTLIDADYNAGFHTVSWNGKDNDSKAVSSGVYLYQITADSYSHVKKMSLLR